MHRRTVGVDHQPPATPGPLVSHQAASGRAGAAASMMSDHATSRNLSAKISQSRKDRPADDSPATCMACDLGRCRPCLVEHGLCRAQMSKSDVVASLAPGANDGFAVELEGASLSLSRRVHSLHGERARGNQWCLLAALALPGSGCHEVASNRHPSHICQQRH